MSSLNTYISVQINKEDKEKATAILQKIRVSMSGLINMTLKQLILKGGIPFDVSLPKEKNELYQYFSNEEIKNMAKEISDIEKNPEKYKSYDNIQDLKKDLLSDD